MRSLLRRCLTCSLALYLLGGLATLSVPAHEVRAQTTSSSSTAIQITEAYVGLLGRAPDPAGLSYWVKQLDAAVAAGRDATLALKKLMNDIANSPEYKAGPQGTSVPTTGNPSEAQAAAIVQDIYSNLFDRNASQADLDYWTPQLTGGSTTAPEMTINLITAAKSNPSGADGQVLGYKEDAATYYAQNVAGERFTRGEAEQAVEGVIDELTLAKSIDSTDALADGSTTPPSWDLYSRDVTELNGLIDFPECGYPSPNHIKFMLDVDLDGDQDVVMGFECIMYTQDGNDLKDQLTYDEFYGWITDSYLAVFINDNGEFGNDQSIFDGEYPMYDQTLKSWWPINVGDVNGDGYEDMVIAHHWDNSTYNAINERLISREKVPASEYWNAGSVMISDGVGGYKTHLLPMQTWQSVPQFYTDELGDTYVWLFSDYNTMWNFNGMYEDYQKSGIGLEVRPYVGKVVGADLIDVTDQYWEKLYNTNSRSDSEYCYIARSMAVNGEYRSHPHIPWELPCTNPENWLPTNYAVEQLAGKVYVNPARNIAHHQIFTGDERITHCYDQSYSGGFEQRGRLQTQCALDASTNQPWMFDSLAVLAMDSERGVYIEETHQHTGEFRYYLKDPDVPVSEGGEYEAVLYIYMGDQIQLNLWGWGLTIAEEPETGDLLAMSNMGGVMLDAGATIDDAEELALFILREFHRPGRNTNTIEDIVSASSKLFEVMEAGFCPDVLELVEPEDCIDPEYWTENLTNRYQDFGRDNGFSIGHRVSADAGEIVAEPKLTNLNMAYNPFRTQLIDFDSDGDLDLYIKDNNQDCGPMCFMENLGGYEFEQNLEGIWADADDAFWNFQYEQCKGPQRPEDGFFGGLCQLVNPTTAIDKLFRQGRGSIHITDVNGDGILDFYALKHDHNWAGTHWDEYLELNIIYGE